MLISLFIVFFISVFTVFSHTLFSFAFVFADVRLCFPEPRFIDSAFSALLRDAFFPLLHIAALHFPMPRFCRLPCSKQQKLISLFAFFIFSVTVLSVALLRFSRLLAVQRFVLSPRVFCLYGRKQTISRGEQFLFRVGRHQ